MCFVVACYLHWVSPCKVLLWWIWHCKCLLFQVGKDLSSACISCSTCFLSVDNCVRGAYVPTATHFEHNRKWPSVCFVMLVGSCMLVIVCFYVFVCGCVFCPLRHDFAVTYGMAVECHPNMCSCVHVFLRALCFWVCGCLQFCDISKF